MNGHNILKKYLTTTEISKWERNVERLSSYSLKEHALNKNYVNASDFIDSSFVWTDSYEGHDYWSNLRRKMDSLDSLYPKKKIKKHVML